MSLGRRREKCLPCHCHSYDRKFIGYRKNQKSIIFDSSPLMSPHYFNWVQFSKGMWAGTGACQSQLNKSLPHKDALLSRNNVFIQETKTLRTLVYCCTKTSGSSSSAGGEILPTGTPNVGVQAWLNTWKWGAKYQPNKNEWRKVLVPKTVPEVTLRAKQI